MTWRWRSYLFVLLAALHVSACRSDRSAASAPPAVVADDEGAPVAPPSSSAASAAGATTPALRESHEHDHGDHDHLHDALVDCPIAERAQRDGDALLRQADESFDAGAYDQALACADIAADLLPQAVEAHHLRAAALAALGRFAEAQIAFTMALALDPDDPETLAAAADFYINVFPPKRRDTTVVGLEYARRGRARALSRRNRNRPLQARLALLEAQALNDLGRPDEALPLIKEALDKAPRLLEARHEEGVALFNLLRFDRARAAFLAVLGTSPDDPYAHHHLGLIYERLGRPADAEAHFRRARELAPEEFWEPVILSPEAFEEELAKAVRELPTDLRAMLLGVSLEVADTPDTADLQAVEPPFSPTILGLFRGLPHGVDAPAGSRIPPRAIVLYRKNLGRAVKSRSELDQQIRRTLVHEIGHLRGLDEDELRRRGLE